MKSDVSFCKRYLNIKSIFAGNDKQTARQNKNSHILGKIWELMNDADQLVHHLLSVAYHDLSWLRVGDRTTGEVEERSVRGR